MTTTSSDFEMIEEVFIKCEPQDPDKHFQNDINEGVPDTINNDLFEDNHSESEEPVIIEEEEDSHITNIWPDDCRPTVNETMKDSSFRLDAPSEHPVEFYCPHFTIYFTLDSCFVENYFRFNTVKSDSRKRKISNKTYHDDPKSKKCY